jgi:hypothetical protein
MVTMPSSHSESGRPAWNETTDTTSSNGHTTPGSEDVTLGFPETGSAPNTPKRKKSLLLTRLMGFTAM